MKFLTAAAVAVLMTSSALAQQAPATDGNRPSAMPQSQPPGNEGAAPFKASPGDTTGQQGMSSSQSSSVDPNQFQTNQAQDQWLVGNLWRKNVYNQAGQSIGDLNDLIIDKDGKIAAVVIGVGGFLGLGEKNVAVHFDQLQQHGGVSPNRIVLNMSEQDLRNAPTFQRSSSGSSSSSTNR
jgi:sporulation protein YlmC with PRC-barrel domain